MRGSGTSESTAIASGAVALILDKFPHATPDQVKRLHQERARTTCRRQSTRQVGSGELRLEPILSAPLPVYAQSRRTSGGRRVARTEPADRIT